MSISRWAVIARGMLLVAVLFTLTGCLLPVKLTAEEATAIARSTLPAPYAKWSDVEVTLRPREWVVTFRNIKTTPEALGWLDAAYPRGTSVRYRDATVYIHADTGAVVRKELTP